VGAVASGLAGYCNHVSPGDVVTGADRSPMVVSPTLNLKRVIERLEDGSR
jgi:hypothetical protein